MTRTTTLDHLALSIPWIGTDPQKIERLSELLSEAITHAGQFGSTLVSRLIERFTYLSFDEYEQQIFHIARYLSEEFDLERTVLCATTGDRTKDSAQKVLYDLTSALAAIGRYKLITLNRYDSLVKEKAAFDQAVLVDEFIGTGTSLAGRVRAIRRQFRDASRAAPKIHAIAIVGMTVGLRSIAPLFESLNVCIALSKGIMNHAPPEQLLQEYSTMEILESALASASHGHALPRLGYGQSEALYSRRSGSCPNNVLPIFWWPELTGPTPRTPLFPRAM